MQIKRQKNFFIALPPSGKRQAAIGTALADADLTKRHNGVVTIEDVVQRETVYDCGGEDIFDETVESRLKRVRINYSSVTAQTIAMWLAYFLGAAAAPVASGSQKKHALTRSSGEDLPKLGFVTGFEDVSDSIPQKYQDFVVESLNINLNRRKNVTLEVVTVGNWTTADAGGDFVLPVCENLPALKGRDCKITINGVSYDASLWQNGMQFSNNVPTGDDAFPFNGVDVSVLERGDKPTYAINLQILGERESALYNDASAEAVRAVVVQLGADADDHVVITTPSTKLKFGSARTQFVGEINQTAIQLTATPYKDAGLGTPIKADAFLSQTTAFLLT